MGTRAGRPGRLGDAIFSHSDCWYLRSFSGRHSRRRWGDQSLLCVLDVTLENNGLIVLPQKMAPDFCSHNGDSWRLTKTSEEAAPCDALKSFRLQSCGPTLDFLSACVDNEEILLIQGTPAACVTTRSADLRWFSIQPSAGTQPASSRQLGADRPPSSAPCRSSLTQGGICCSTSSHSGWTVA